ncbi:MAG: deoxyribodipyrimidine photolyase [Myxococcota bacterium]
MGVGQMTATPEARIRRLNDHSHRPDGDFVLYWMVANRRPKSNFALQRAAEIAASLEKPLLVLEGLRSDYRWASDRLHSFVIQGMRDNERWFAKKPAHYIAYLEPSPGAGRGLLETLGTRAAAVVSDDFPAFFLPRMLAAAAPRIPVGFEAVDSNGMYPMRATDRVFTTAASFRRHLQKELPPHLDVLPWEDPLQKKRLPKPTEALEGWLRKTLTKAWAPANREALEDPVLSAFPIDHSVGKVGFEGGFRAAEAALGKFLDQRLSRYTEGRNHPDDDSASGLSPWLHFGHVSVHQIFAAITGDEGWTRHDLAKKAHGSRTGYWNLSEASEAFFDELITWREIGFNMCAHRSDYTELSSLPAWAIATIDAHRKDARPTVYSAEAMEAAETGDDIWNAAQRQLVREGRMHNYLRMLWGKKVYEWSPTPEEALERLVHLNNKYAVDGRNPNSYSGIFWCFGRYDRAWGPERKIFGKLRYMSSDATRRKLKLKHYLARYGDQPTLL